MQDDLLADINDILKGCSLPKMRRDTICAYGVTGSGKSTLINYLLNNEMKYEKNFGKFCIEKVNNDQKGPDVGNTMISETTRPQSYPWKNKQQLFDLPGNEDTRGFKEQIFNASLVQKSLKKGLKIKMMLVVSIFELQSGKGLNFFEIIHRLQKLLGNDFLNLTNSLCIVVTKVSNQYDQEDVKSILADSVTVNAHLLSKASHSILEEVVKQERVYIFRYPEHKNFKKELNIIRKSLMELNPYALEENAKPSVSALAVRELLRIQKNTVFDYNKNTQILEVKLRNWVNNNALSNQIEYLKQCKKKLAVLKRDAEKKRERNFIVRINEEFGFGFSDDQLTNRFFTYIEKVNFCSKFTLKEEVYRQEEFVNLINGFIQRFQVRRGEIAEKLKLEKTKIRQEEREEKQEQNLRKKFQKQQRQREKQKRERQRELGKQNKRIEKQFQREKVEKERRQRQLQEQIEREKTKR